MKKFTVSILTLALLLLSAGSAFGATDAKKLDEIKTLTQQMYSIHLQIIDKQVEAGFLNVEKAADIKKFLEQRQKRMEEDMANGKFTGFGKKGGCGHKGRSPNATPQTPPSPPNANP